MKDRQVDFKKKEKDDHGTSDRFSLLPEGCISHIISLTAPKDACRAAAVSWGFKSASESDTVWKQFLPLDYKEIISDSDSPMNYSTKKELFFQLCDSLILLDGGKLCFRLCKSSGKKCYMLCARELSIAWKDAPRHWIWTSFSESRFSEVAMLLDVCWLDIRGKMHSKMLSPNTKYAAYLVFKIHSSSYGLATVSKASVKFDDNADECDSVYLSPKTYSDQLVGRRWEREAVQHNNGRHPQNRKDGWMEIYLGEFSNDERNGEIEMQFCETSVLDGKQGLILEGIELRPKEDGLDSTYTPTTSLTSSQKDAQVSTSLTRHE